MNYQAREIFVDIWFAFRETKADHKLMAQNLGDNQTFYSSRAPDVSSSQ